MTVAAELRTVAWIDEDRCIGCTLCIQACPADAIVGAAKRMHTVIAEQCTGCDECLPPCPVDCIEMRPVDTPLSVQQVPGRGPRRVKTSNRDAAPAHRAPIQDDSRRRKAVIAAALARQSLKKTKTSPR